ncbi:hypothetical protein QVD17_37115 [Tagetes erecta]|uniref:Cytochrome P450 n=1 Tax=Tagetes erecta TaxID=13708 RepID=A0AAD8JVE9_TARER|nr:hypothetical protein QVD17_37115 [Tagetes erecta]
MDAVSNTVAISCAIVVVLCAWKIVNMVWVRPKKLEKYLRNQGFNGNKYKLLFGDMKELSMMFKHSKSKHINIDDEDEVLPHVTAYNYHSLQKYGRNFVTWIGWNPRVTIMEPEIIKDVLTKLNYFQKSKSNPMVVKYLASALTSDVISRTAFGSSYEEGVHIFELITEQSVSLMEALQSVYIPGSRFLPTKRNMRMKAIDNKVNHLIRSIIDNKLKAMKAGEGNYDDLLGIMLDSNNKMVEQHQNKSHGITIEEVIEECKVFYFAGQETTSSLLVWTMILLSKHKEWQSRARDEVLNVLGDKTIDIDGLNRLKVINMIFYEVLRLYPPVVGLARQVCKDITLGGFSFPSGIQISIPTILIHYDEQLWGSDAKKFKPERFSEGISKATKNQVIYIPFGGGPRICIGQNFALLEAKLALAMILQKFLFELSQSYVHAPNIVITLQPQYGAHLILHKL